MNNEEKTFYIIFANEVYSYQSVNLDDYNLGSGRPTYKVVDFCCCTTYNNQYVFHFDSRTINRIVLELASNEMVVFLNNEALELFKQQCEQVSDRLLQSDKFIVLDTVLSPPDDFDFEDKFLKALSKFNKEDINLQL